MAAFVIYIIRWGVVLTLLYSLYGLLMKRETLHGVNRIVLLLVLLASMVLPLCQIDTNETNIVVQGREMIEYQIRHSQNSLSNDVERITVVNLDNDIKHTSIPIYNDINSYILTAIAIYLLGLVICWLCYLIPLVALVRLICRGKRIEMVGLPKHVVMITHSDIKTPSSWMRWIFLSPEDVNTRAIINHELAHIRYGHSWDMLLCEFTCRMLWCVPFAWMLRQDLRDVHEFQADRRVLATGINDEEYQLLLIRKATGTGLQPIVNALNQSPIKRRFKMMYMKPSRRWVALKAAYILPLSALALVALARPQTLGEVEQQVMIFADTNLVKADLRSWSSEKDIDINTNPSKDIVYVLDSVMEATGARKVGEGMYAGHFKPTLNSDTIHIANVVLLNLRSTVTASHTFQHYSSDAYNIVLMSATRRNETGYYIRQLTHAVLPHYNAVPRDVPVSRKYDQRPKNKQPKLERPAWSNYNLQNDRSFAAFSNVQTAPAGQGHPVIMEQGSPTNGLFTLYRCQDATYVAYDKKIPLDQDWFFYRWMEGSKIIDTDTGDQYMIRRLEHFPLNQCFWIYGQSGQTIRIIAVYPPLPLSVKRVQLHEANGPSRQWFSGEGYTTKPYSINELRPKATKPQGCIIR